MLVLSLALNIYSFKGVYPLPFFVIYFCLFVIPENRKDAVLTALSTGVLSQS